MSDELPLHPGQWRLSRVEVFNWGTFGGHHTIPVSRQGTLITGESGSGKSTLLDAISTALTPPGKRSYNAAARSGGARGEDRTLVSYIRGAYAHNAASTGEIANVYLRPRAATWSGVLLVYDCALEDGATVHEPVNLVALFHLKAGSVANDDVSKLFGVVRGRHELAEFAPFVERGIDISGFNRAYKKIGNAFNSFSGYVAKFTRMLGISSPKTLELLHKTQAAKNFGSLDELFRKFMLDEPKTYQLADEAVEQFSSLAVAYTGVKEQRVQMEALAPLELLDEQRGMLQRQEADARRLQESIAAFAHGMALEQLCEERRNLVRERERLEERYRAAERAYENAQKDRERAQMVFEQNDGLVYDSAEKDVLTGQKHVEEILMRRSALLKDLSCLGVESVPLTYADFSELKRSAKEAADQAERQRRDLDEENIEKSIKVGKLRESVDAASAELRHLRQRPTNIPRRFHSIRCDIASAIGADERDLPFVGEMIDVRPHDADWTGALERLIGRSALILLVPTGASSAVASYVNATHLGERFEFAAVQAEVEVPSKKLSVASSVRKLKVARHDTHPEFSDYVNALLRTRFNYECVDSPNELHACDFALTREGLIKRRNSYLKDDRRKIDDRSRWLLGTSNDAKIFALGNQLEKAKDDLTAAEMAMEALRSAQKKAFEIVRTSRYLEGADWKNYDIEAARSDLEGCKRYLDELRDGSSGLAQAADAREAAATSMRSAQEAVIGADRARQDNDSLIEEKDRAIAETQEKVGSEPPVSDGDKEALLALFAQEDSKFRKTVQRLYEVSMAVSGQLGAERDKAIEQLMLTERKIGQIQHAFKIAWPMQTADLGDAPSDIAGYVGILRRIRSTGLPEYETKFLKVLTDFSQDRITALNTAIRGAFREVRQKLEPVNRSLSMSEYAPGIHLQMKVRSCRSAQAEEFLSDLRSILDNEWADDGIEEAEKRYHQLSRLVKRLSSPEYADRKWRSICLDTREHVTFIAEEIDASGQVHNVHSTDAGLSGGQKQKLVIFCLAAALRYQLSDEDEALPSYATVILDEAFSKADIGFTKTAMDIFNVFGFHMILATPLRMLKTLDRYMGAYVYVHCEDEKYSTAQYLGIEDVDAADAADAGAVGVSVVAGGDAADADAASAADARWDGGACEA